MKRHQTRGMSRRDFLGTGAKIGAGLALASAGLDLTANKSEAAGGITLNYMGLGNNPAPFAHGQRNPGPVHRVSSQRHDQVHSGALRVGERVP